MKPIIAALAAALLTATAAHAQDTHSPEDRAAWQALQGRWTGRFRLDEDSCRWKGGATRAFKVDFRIKADADLDDPENGPFMTGRAGKRRYGGLFMGVDPAPCDDYDDDSCYQDEGANAVFYSNAPVRMTDGSTCRLTYDLAYYYTGGPTAAVDFTDIITCQGDEVCRTTYHGTLKKARR
jgi:hypothetical protein